jgi:predicted RNA-binding protein with PUA-like domain
VSHWLLKSEPGSFSIDDLQRVGVEHWDGVRNYVARNNLVAMRVGERGFFYHSSAEPPGVAGVCEIVHEAYPDHTQFDPASKYFDPKATPDKPRWFMPDVQFVGKFARLVSLREIKETPGLEQMDLVRWSRLSVSRVTDEEWEIICALAGWSEATPSEELREAPPTDWPTRVEHAT